MPSKRIAVIGLSSRYAGGVHTPEQLWANLRAGIDPITDFPHGRWDKGYLHPDHDVKGRSYIYAGGYLDDVEGFDAEFFGISPREAQQIDPQQRLLLELAWEALEDAGIVPEHIAGSSTGVFVGLSSRDYGDFFDDVGIDAYTNLGLSLSIASNRVSYVLDLKGPSMTIDTACSSGMVALHQAVESLHRGECGMALVGAANLVLSPKAFIGFSKASMLSPQGRCTTFDANGAGYVRAEGGGVLVLKPLDDAERDGDNILGVIVGTGANADGRTMGIALPSADAQAALLEKVYRDAGIRPDQVYYVEAHGTGTAVGDPIECEAIARVLGGSNRQGPLRVGSIKSNVGHLEPAAGIAGLTKALLALRHREIPAQLHFKTPNPKIDFDGWKLEVVAQPHPLPQTDEPLVFGINSFGFGGTNAHCVLQEYRPAGRPVARRAPDTTADADAPSVWKDLLLVSGQSAAAAQAMAGRWAERLLMDQAPAGTDAAARWETLRAAALHQRTHHPHRLAVWAGSTDEAVQRLQEHLLQGASAHVVTGRAPLSGRQPTAWVYAGNGPQWWGMGRELLVSDATYRRAVEQVDALFRPMAGWSLIDELMRDADSARMQLTEIAQPTLFALQVGLSTVLRSAGLRPDAVIGHSVGEAAAAWASGALSLEQATRVIHQRSQAQGTTAGLGRMAALGIPARQAQALIDEIGGFLELAATNSPGAVTVAGELALLEKLCQRVVDEGKFARVLNLDYAFHTRAMDGIRDSLTAGLQGLQPRATHTPFISTVEGRPVEGSALGPDYWWRNVREPVAFQAGVTHLIDAMKITGFIEIGPHPVLRDYLLQNAKARAAQVTVLTSLRRPKGDADGDTDTALMRQTIGAAYAHGLGDPRDLAPATAARPALPTYAWQRVRHWRGEHPLPDQRPATRRDHPLLGWRTSPAGTVWESQPDLGLLPWLADHVIQDAIVFPGAAYIEMALAAAAQALGSVAVQLEGVEFQKPMVIPRNGTPVLQCRVDDDGCFEIRSRSSARSADHITLHSRGRLTAAEPSHRPAPIDTGAAWAHLPVSVDHDSHYAGTAQRGMHYGPGFRSVNGIRMSADDAPQRTAAAWITLPAGVDGELTPYRSHPSLLDGCLQMLIPVLARRDRRLCSYIPVRVERLRSFAPLPARLFCEARLLRDSERSGQADFRLFDDQGQCVMVLEGARFQKVDFGGREAMRLADRWRPDPATPVQPGRRTPLPAPSSLLSLSPVPAPVSDSRLDSLCACYAAEALQALQRGAGLDAGEPLGLSSLQRRAKVLPELRPLLAHLVVMAREDGWLREEDDGLHWTGKAAPLAADLWQQLALASPGRIAELMLLAQVGERLPALLTGEAEPVSPLGERSHPAFETLLDTAPYSAEGLRRLTGAVTELVRQWPLERPLRVLEIDAGLGGLSAHLLPVLPPLRTEYTVSDRDPQVVERLAQRLGQAVVVSTLALDLGNDSALAGLREQFDLVLCADGLTRSGLPAAEALARVQPLVAPGGWLLMLAPLRQRMLTLVFGQRPDWWHNGTLPLHEPSTWEILLEGTGWGRPLLRPLESQLMLCAQAGDRPDAAAPAAAPEAAVPALDWLLLTDLDDTGQAFALQVAESLARSGQRVRHIAVTADDVAPEGTWRADDSDALAQLLREPTHRLVHLAGLARRDGLPITVQPLRCLPLIALAQTQQREDAATLSKPRLVVVARGATPGPGLAQDMDPAQAPVWGLARVLSNEHADFAPRMIDLHAPLDATLADRLVQEMLREDGETEVLLDPHARWVQRLEASSLGDLAAAARSLPGGALAPDDGMALRLQATQQGGLDGLALRAAPRRAPGAGEVELAVRAAGLNFRDVLWAMNMLPEEAVEDGFSGATIGMECAGEVVAVGDGVTGLAVGDRVIGFASGCFATHVTTSAGAVSRIPASLDWAEAATLPTAFLTAWYALTHLARLEPGERVLIHGAAGGVGLAAVQIARLRGATVFGTAGNEEKRRLLRLYGVDHVLDSRSLAFADDILALTDGQGVDVVLNSLAGEAITKNLQILRPFGRLLEIGKRDLYANSRIGLRPFRLNVSYFGIDADTLLIERPALARRMFAEVAEQVALGRLRPLPHQALPMARASRAFRLMQQSRHVGKIVVTLPDPTDGTVRSTPQALPETWQANPEGTYLVTGGLGGFGLATAQWMVQRGARSMALVSRRGATTDEARAGIAAMEAMGATVRAYAADVGNAGELERVLDEVRQTQAPLVGVLHSAMVLDDAPLLLLNRERLMKVLGPKIDGAWHLHRLTLKDRLECFVVYSSATVVIGNPGQGNYVAGNIYLQALAQWRRAQGLPALSIAWGAIKDVGVVTRTDGLASLLEKRSGIAATPAAEALEELGRMLASHAVAVSVAPFNMQRLIEMMPAAMAPRFRPLAPEGGVEPGGVVRETLADRWKATPAEARRPVVVDVLRDHLARILGTAASQVDIERPLADMGLDSLMAVELASSLEREVGRPVSVMQMIQASSAAAVVDTLLQMLEPVEHA